MSNVVMAAIGGKASFKITDFLAHRSDEKEEQELDEIELMTKIFG